MTQYFLRRLLLAIPTFIGCTLIVFIIVQVAPGGPLEQQIMALKVGSGGENAAAASNGANGVAIPKEALEGLREYYGFDEPVMVRYLIWLGVWPRKVDAYVVKPGEARNVGEGVSALVLKQGNEYKVMDASNPSRELTGWSVDEKTLENGDKRIRVFHKKFSGILTGNFGTSYIYHEEVGTLLLHRMNISIQFGLISLILTYTVCVYLGIQKALRHGSFFDVASSVLVFIGYSVPGWALGLLLLVLFGGGSFWNVFPLGSFQSSGYESLSFFNKIIDRAYHAVLPAIGYTIGGFATFTVLMKNSILENISQDYIRTAFAKGLRERRVIWVHAMRNSIIPIASQIGFLLGVFLTGSYFIEWVFNIDGIGKLSYQAILSRDYPIVFAFTVISVLIQLLGAIISDFALAMVDPRIRFK